MRRSDKEILDKEIIEAIIKESSVCRVGMCDNGIPYVVPLCFGYAEGCIFIHCANKGKKIDILKNNPAVCIEFESAVELIAGDASCNWSMKYKSAIGFGKASFISDNNEKIEALDAIMLQYSDKSFEFEEKDLKRTTIIKITLESITGKQSGF